MPRRAFTRLYVTLTTLVVVMLAWACFAPEAKASILTRAPVCDPRGAITFAPPPQMQDPTSSLDIVVNEDDCSQSPLESRNAVPSRAPRCCDGQAVQEPAATDDVPLLTGSFAGPLLAAPAPTDSFVRPGFRVDFERPPRA